MMKRKSRKGLIRDQKDNHDLNIDDAKKDKLNGGRKKNKIDQEHVESDVKNLHENIGRVKNDHVVVYKRRKVKEIVKSDERFDFVVKKTKSINDLMIDDYRIVNGNGRVRTSDHVEQYDDEGDIQGVLEKEKNNEFVGIDENNFNGNGGNKKDQMARKSEGVLGDNLRLVPKRAAMVKAENFIKQCLVSNDSSHSRGILGKVKKNKEGSDKKSKQGDKVVKDDGKRSTRGKDKVVCFFVSLFAFKNEVV